MIELLLADVLFTLTAYSIGCDAPGPHTKVGVPPQACWSVAVDPAVIPLGSVLEIDGVDAMTACESPGGKDRRVAHDIGPKVRGRSIDLFLASCDGPHGAKRWSNKRARVRVIHRGGTREWLCRKP